MKYLYLILLFLMVYQATSGQDPFCETKTNKAFLDRFDQLIKSRDQIPYSRNQNEVISVPIVFHIEIENGNPVYGETTLNNKLALVNTYYAPGNILLTNCQPILYYEGTSTPSVKHAINVYLYKGSSGCGVASGTLININVNCNRTFEHILAHEVGHALGLPHTHGYTNSGTTTELVDGSNCATAGDRFCDTPADPNLLGFVNGSCIYTGTGTDANGEQYMPDVTNIMSYTRSSCADKFSGEQLAKMYMVAVAANHTCCRIDPPLVADTFVCAGEKMILTASTDVPTAAIHWYDQQAGGTPIAIGESFETDTLDYSTTYFVEVVDSCISDRIPVKITVKPNGGLQLFDIDLFADLNPNTSQGSYFSNYLTVADTMMLLSADLTIYKVGLTDDTLQILTDTFELNPNRNLSAMIQLGQFIIVGINDFNNGPSLWRGNLITNEWELLKDFGPTYGYSNYYLTKVGSYVMALLNSPGEIGEIWKTDGSSSGTELLLNLTPSNAFMDYAFTEYQDHLVFKRQTVAEGEELWMTDGSNTFLIKDLNPGTAGSNISSIVEMNGLLYFAAEDSTNGIELWVTDGTGANTALVKDINPDGSAVIYGLTAINGMLYFTADDGATGNELYKSDGTNAGTFLVEDLHSSGGSFPSNFTRYKDEVYFTANDAIHSTELFKENNQTGDLELVKDINPGSLGVLGGLIVFRDLLYLSATDGDTGFELWQSNGSLFGTQLALDIYAGNQSSNPSGFYTFNQQLFFTANPGNGNVLFRLIPPPLEVCFGTEVQLTSHTPNDINWYNSEGVFISNQHQINLPGIDRNTMIYGKIQDNTCTSPWYEVMITIKENCPCQDFSNQLIETVFTTGDQFIISSSNQIQSISIFQSGSNMQFKAVDQIILLPGFDVNLGAGFEALMEGCE